jgi:hypothetical protein
MNDRELAALIWLGAVLLAVLFHPKLRDVRRSSRDVLSAAVPLAVPLFAMVVYVCGLVVGASQLGLWEPSLWGDTVAWCVGTGIGLFGKAVSVFNRDGSLWRVARTALGLTLLVEAFVNLYVFPLLVELVLVPFAVFLGALSAFAESQEGFEPARKLVDGLLAAAGLLVFVYVGVRLAIGFDAFVDDGGWQKLLLPVWLTAGTLMLFVPLLGLWTTYQGAFNMIDWATDDRRVRRRSRLAIVTGLHLRARDVNAFNAVWCKELARASSWAEARAVVTRFRRRGHANLQTA